MKKILLNKTIITCFDCPMHKERDDVTIECSYLKRFILKSYLDSDKPPIDCPLPDKKPSKLLRITKCSECCHCKPSNLETVITTYPPIYEKTYICDISNLHITHNNTIPDWCKLEDEE